MNYHGSCLCDFYSKVTWVYNKKINWVIQTITELSPTNILRFNSYLPNGRKIATKNGGVQ